VVGCSCCVVGDVEWVVVVVSVVVIVVFVGDGVLLFVGLLFLCLFAFLSFLCLFVFLMDLFSQTNAIPIVKLNSKVSSSGHR